MIGRFSIFKSLKQDQSYNVYPILPQILGSYPCVLSSPRFFLGGNPENNSTQAARDNKVSNR